MDVLKMWVVIAYQVKRNMLICQKVESGIKMGKIDEDIALEYVVLSCLK